MACGFQRQGLWSLTEFLKKLAMSEANVRSFERTRYERSECAQGTQVAKQLAASEVSVLG